MSKREKKENEMRNEKNKTREHCTIHTDTFGFKRSSLTLAIVLKLVEAKWDFFSASLRFEWTRKGWRRRKSVQERKRERGLGSIANIIKHTTDWIHESALEDIRAPFLSHHRGLRYAGLSLFFLVVFKLGSLFAHFITVG